MEKDHMLPSKKSKSTHTHKHILQPTFVWQPNLYQKSIQSNSFHSSSSTKTPLPKLLIPTPTPASHHSCWLVNAISCGPVGYTTLLPSSADHILPATSDTTSWDPLSWCPMVIVDCPEKVPFNFCGGFCHIWGGCKAIFWVLMGWEIRAALTLSSVQRVGMKIQFDELKMRTRFRRGICCSWW